MDGTELETRQRIAPAHGRHVLTRAEQMDLVALASMQVYKTLCKLFDMAIIDARDEAMMVDPADEKRQAARISEARAMALFADKVKRQIEFNIEEHMGAIAAKEIEAALKDQERMAEIICNPLNTKPGFA